MEHPEIATHTAPRLSRAERAARALRAAQAVASRYGIPARQARVLHDANNIVVHLAPSPVVVKICPASAGVRGWFKLAAELEIAHHLVRAGAPVVGPSPELPAQPHGEHGYSITFWRLHHHDPDAPVSGMAAGYVLAQVHRALDSYTSRTWMLSQPGHDLLLRVFLSCCDFPPPVLSRFQELTQKMGQFSGALTL